MGMTVVNPIWVQGHHRWENDDGDMDVSTFAAAEDAAISDVALDTNIRLRFQWGERANQSEKTNFIAQLQYSVDGGTFADVTTTSSNVRAVNTTHFADGATDSTNRLTGAPTGLTTGDHLFTEGDEDGASDERNPSGAYYDVSYTMQFRSADLSGGEVITFQIVDGNGVETVTDRDTTPQATIAGGGGTAEDANAVFFGTNF